ncbi:hypothetical protein BHE90_011728 [Fusarium euwallaceae]|uniref:Zn(2)-C6 fungal-type domain-containing protein n=4 Tax=Fusarium solani species complex TaxID=232080 RepID=A0A3M2RW57_9HYPO|nr:hypothetical protein CDV36_010873 [Fusarium kuroshium]RSL78652.1 hypothetical protein CEP51_008017 [Fusarium floridanum]RSM02462.1 hypothetical protein CEP52_007940 [Fusarium oligoseptatum]RTE73834.1 hypothetical protein BHE90_011728 [Fusarium euwallaceae]
MVYCGKASQGCQNCRTRRIKCDKVKPECSQCIRVGKRCPGYRDQLSLMFRDESSKVMQKAHAQWGVGESGSEMASQASSSSSASSSASNSASAASSVPTLSCSTSTNTTLAPYSAPSSAISSSASSATYWSSTSPSSLVSHQTSPPTPPSPTSYHQTSSASAAQLVAIVPPPRLPTPVDPSLEEQGVQFYINRYLIGHPDEPKTPGDLSSTEWLWDPAVQDVMAAVGLASLSNLRGDNNLMTTARQRYGMALRQTGRLIQTSVTPDFEVTMRSVVMLAMFELVKGANQNIAHVHAHVMGGVALLRRWLPMPEVAFLGVRAMLQMCYCLFIPAQMSATPLPAPFYEWITFSCALLDPPDRPAADLGMLICRFIDLSTHIQTYVLSDGRPHTTSTLKQLLDIDAAFAEWDRKLGPTWRFRTEKRNNLPPAAVFEGEYHIYFDMFVARMWGHYRWARTLLNRIIADFIKSHPVSSSSLVTTSEYKNRLEVVRLLARDTLISTPTHWRHPLLTDKFAIPVENMGGAGSGSAGLPIVLFHLQAAACGPGSLDAYWDWAIGVMECIWSDLGILHAKSMMDTMRSHRDSSFKIKTEKDLNQGGAKVVR